MQKHGVVPDQRSTPEHLRDQAYEYWASAKISAANAGQTAQQVYADTKDSAFDTWDESQLRAYLVKHNIVAPKGPKESLVKAANDYYASAASAASDVSASATSAASSVSSAASAGASVIGDHLNKAKGQVYDSWTESQLRLWLQDRGIIPPPRSKSQQLIDMVRINWWHAESTASGAASSVSSAASAAASSADKAAYDAKAAVTSAPQRAWASWTDSQLRDWLVDHNVLDSKTTLKRKELENKIQSSWNTATRSAASLLPEYTPNVNFFDRKPTLAENVTSYLTSSATKAKHLTQAQVAEVRNYFQKQVLASTPSIETLSTSEWWEGLGKRIEGNAEQLQGEAKGAVKKAGKDIKKTGQAWSSKKDELVAEANSYIDEIFPGNNDYTLSAVLSGIREKLSDGSEFAKDKLEHILDLIRGGESTVTSAGHKATKAAKSAYSAGKEEL